MKYAHSIGTPDHQVIPVMISLNDKQAQDEFRTLLAKALNTWDQAPQWLFDMADSLAQPPIPPRMKRPT